VSSESDIEPLFPKGSPAQNIVDKFLSRFSAEKAREFNEIFVTRRTILCATNPEMQAEIDLIYEALAKRARNDPPQIILYEPGPVESALIEEYLAAVPAEHVEAFRRAFFAANANVRSDDPMQQKKLDAIYAARETEAEFRFDRDRGGWGSGAAP
jgi:hypothetical protein